MKDRVLSTIRLITATKIMNRTEPAHALFNEVVEETGLPTDVVRKTIGDLFRDGLIEGGKTMHDHWVKAIVK